MEKSTLRLFLLGRRVLSADLVRRVSDIRYLEKEIEGDYRSLRLRVARRLRSHRHRALQKARLERLVTAGYVFARDLSAWQQWRDNLRAALEHTVTEIGLALSRDSLLERQVRKAMALAARTTAPLTIHVNSRTRPALQRLLATLEWPEDAMAHSLIITEYLEDDSCIIETPNGLFEASVDLEVAAFCQGVTSYLDGAGAGDPARGEQA